MKLSIIMPVYNAEKYLRRCLDSLVEQSLDEYEIIAINDGSKDGSEAILREYSEKYPEKLRYINVENGGQGRARNIGISMAKGAYIGFCDSDDWVEPTMYEKLYNAAVESGADMAECDSTMCFEDGTESYFSMTGYVDRMHMTTCVWNKLFKKELIEDIRFPEGLWYEDLTYVMKAAVKAGEIVRLSEPLYFYRIGQTSTMNNNNSAKNLDIIRILEGLEDTVRPYSEEGFDSLILNHALIDTVNRVAAQNSPDKKQVIEKILDYVHKNIPYLPANKAYLAESRSRRIIMFLNYNSLETVSQLIFKTKKLLKR